VASTNVCAGRVHGRAVTGGLHAACQRGAAINTRRLHSRLHRSPPPGSSGWSDDPYGRFRGATLEEPRCSDYRTTMASSMVAWVIDALGRCSGYDHRSTEATATLPGNTPRLFRNPFRSHNFRRQGGWHRLSSFRFFEIDAISYPIYTPEDRGGGERRKCNQVRRKQRLGSR
jgi:hypothetical protein